VRHRVLLVARAGAVAICAVVLGVLAVLIQRPLAELHQKIARVREGDLTVGVGFARRHDEIGELGQNFNEMVRQLRQSREEIERLLAAASTQMSRAEHLATLGELAAGLAHEIRNPLAGIAGVIEIIGRDLPPASPSREVLQEVQREVFHIKRILSDLLEYARPRSPDFRPGNLNAAVEHAAALARQQALSRPIQIELHEAEDLPPVEHDAAQIQQVLLNLLLNAIQAIPDSGTVRMATERRSDFAVVTVSDSGGGIPPEHLANLFRPFFTTKGGGTGLGLSLARRIVEAHGGRIEVSSTPGQGSEFRVWLPLGKAAAAGPGFVVK
jgi:signal transduction histidine kinase